MTEPLEQIIREYETRLGLQNYMFPLDLRLTKMLQAITGEDQGAHGISLHEVRRQINEAKDEIDWARHNLSDAADRLSTLEDKIDRLLPKAAVQS